MAQWRRHSSDFKFRVALEATKGIRVLSESVKGSQHLYPIAQFVASTLPSRRAAHHPASPARVKGRQFPTRRCRPPYTTEPAISLARPIFASSGYCSFNLAR